MRRLAYDTDWVSPTGVRVARGAAPFDGPRIILDSDYGPDVDDLVAHAFLHGLANEGECQIIATVACINNAKSPGALDAVNTWHGRGDIPVGGFTGTVDGGALFPNGGAGSESDGDAWAVDIYDASATYPRTVTDTNYADAVDVYRQALHDAPDGSVTVVTIGMLNVLSAVIDSAGDGIDSRSGSDLIAAKVDKVVVMGTNNSGGAEFNIRNAPAEAKNVADNSPVPIWWQPFQIGSTVYTGKWSGTEQAGHIVRFGMEAFNFTPGSDGNGRQSWDACAVLAAVRPWDEGRFTREQGTMTVDPSDGTTVWAAGSGSHYRYEKAQSDSGFEAEIEPLVFNPEVGV